MTSRRRDPHYEAGCRSSRRILTPGLRDKGDWYLVRIVEPVKISLSGIEFVRVKAVDVPLSVLLNAGTAAVLILGGVNMMNLFPSGSIGLC